MDIPHLETYLHASGKFQRALRCTFRFNGTIAEARKLLEDDGFVYSSELEKILSSGEFVPCRLPGSDEERVGDWNEPEYDDDEDDDVSS